MRCKPGDLAVIVRAVTAPSNLGAVVEVIERIYADATGMWREWKLLPEHDYWLVRATGRPLACNIDELHAERPCNDSALQPISFTNGPDETHEWAGYPTRSKA